MDLDLQNDEGNSCTITYVFLSRCTRCKRKIGRSSTKKIWRSNFRHSSHCPFWVSTHCFFLARASPRTAVPSKEENGVRIEVSSHGCFCQNSALYPRCFYSHSPCMYGACLFSFCQLRVCQFQRYVGSC